MTYVESRQYEISIIIFSVDLLRTLRYFEIVYFYLLTDIKIV